MASGETKVMGLGQIILIMIGISLVLGLIVGGLGGIFGIPPGILGAGIGAAVGLIGVILLNKRKAAIGSRNIPR